MTTDTTPDTPDARTFGAALADVLASLPEGAVFDSLTYYGPDDVGEDDYPYWNASATLTERDDCTHVEGCRHRPYSPEVAGTGPTADAALRVLAERLRGYVR